MIDPKIRALYCLHLSGYKDTWIYFESDDYGAQNIILDFSSVDIFPESTKTIQNIVKGFEDD